MFNLVVMCHRPCNVLERRSRRLSRKRSTRARGQRQAACSALRWALASSSRRWVPDVKLEVKLTSPLKLRKVRSRLYRRLRYRDLAHFSALLEIYKICLLLHRSRCICSRNFRQFSGDVFQILCQIFPSFILNFAVLQ